MARPTEYLLIGGLLFVAIVTAVGVAGSELRQPVGPLTSTWECRWDETSYQSVMVYRDRRGQEIGQSAGAGDCAP